MTTHGPALPWHQHGYLMHCMSGWRALFCVLDNLAPHREVPDPDPDPDFSPDLEGRRGFGWVCRLHDWAGSVGAFGRES